MKIIPESFAGVATTATRVIEAYYAPEQRLFDDPLAIKLLPFGWRLALRLAYLPGLRNAVLALREKRMPGTLGAILCRTRYIDDILKQSLSEGLKQAVILGAGFDTRPYRIPEMGQIRIFEVDLPGTRRLKRKRVASVLGSMPENVTLIGMDFDRENLAEVLTAAGFEPQRSTLFIWEGVTQYLTKEAVRDTLDFVGQETGPGSGIVFTYVPLGLVDGSDRPDWFTPFLHFAERIGSPFIFGLNQSELESFLSARNLQLVEDVGAAEFWERYLKHLERELNLFDAERVAFARVKVS
jgi:methyltransferase (TIGR00027 family)